jgi:hypothetical protein
MVISSGTSAPFSIYALTVCPAHPTFYGLTKQITGRDMRQVHRMATPAACVPFPAPALQKNNYHLLIFRQNTLSTL